MLFGGNYFKGISYLSDHYYMYRRFVHERNRRIWNISKFYMNFVCECFICRIWSLPDFFKMGFSGKFCLKKVCYIILYVFLMRISGEILLKRDVNYVRIEFHVNFTSHDFSYANNSYKVLYFRRLDKPIFCLIFFFANNGNESIIFN